MSKDILAVSEHNRDILAYLISQTLEKWASIRSMYLSKLTMFLKKGGEKISPVLCTDTHQL
jgi:hypothetical protein